MYASNLDLWHPSDFNDEAEALINAEPMEACEDDTAISICLSRLGSYTPDTPHSHDFEPCLGGQAHGQGAPVYSCGCYIHTKVNPGLALADALADSDVSEQYQPGILEQDVDSQNTQIGGHSKRVRPPKRKKSDLESKSTFELGYIEDTTVTTPHRHSKFGRNLTNVQCAESVPALEMPKHRKLEKAFEFNESMTRETLLVDAVKHLEAAIDRQTDVLSKIHHVLESGAT
ncbi:hypothetical protein BDR07DRAFT_1481539 [Suillus spraguei]|nr:hypothetical protein BDR07DRAFT_1481539 [Suillus spraguei]